jgi:hydroxymethylpyrimidine pyrophosphatase-like HAD family hydrolase
VLARHPGTRVVVTNKGSIAVVPPEWDKGRGFRAAVADLALGGLPVLAIGDAQNDLPLFAAATIAIAVANADDAVRAAGVLLTAAGTGLGVAEAVNRFVLGARSG